jgi:hypothetical protein
VHDDDRAPPPDDTDDSPSLRQRLHSAAGDRDAEAAALADRADGVVSEEAAKLAVQRAHGDLGAGEPSTASDLATPADAEQAEHDVAHGRAR